MGAPELRLLESPSTSAALRAEVMVSRLWLALGVLVLAFGAICSAMITSIKSLHEENGRLQRSRIMFGFPNEQGVFISSEKRPEYMVVRFAREYVNNLYNYDDVAVDENFKQVAKMMDPAIALSEAQVLSKIAQDVHSTKVSQSFARYRERPLQEDAEFYTYIVEGKVRGQLGSTPTRADEVQITVKLRKVTPTTSRAEGLVVTSMREERLQ